MNLGPQVQKNVTIVIKWNSPFFNCLGQVVVYNDLESQVSCNGTLSLIMPQFAILKFSPFKMNSFYGSNQGYITNIKLYTVPALLEF